jgi:hypothetical protein
MATKTDIAVQTLPDGYQPIEVIDIAKQTGLAIGMNLIGFLLFIISYFVFFRFVRDMRSMAAMQFFEMDSWTNLILVLIGGIFFLAALVILHEAAHGLFFRIYTGSMPKFALKLSYAYAAAPDWYIRRNAYLVIGAAPVVLITLVGLLSCLFVHPSWLVVIVLFMSLNFASSVGDFYVLLRLITKSGDVYVKDEGDKMTFYHPIFEDIPLE